MASCGCGKTCTAAEDGTAWAPPGKKIYGVEDTYNYDRIHLKTSVFLYQLLCNSEKFIKKLLNDRSLKFSKKSVS